VNGHISFSEFKLWSECSHHHKLKYIDGLEGFTGSLFTIFGTAIHSVCENAVKTPENFQPEEHFLQVFQEGKDKLISEGIKVKQTDYEVMIPQAKAIISSYLPVLEKTFPGYEVVVTEEDLMEDVDGTSLKFKGFIDFIIKTPDGKYHIIDWKTCSWGWDAEKKSDKIISYQLTFYKHFWAKKHGIDPKNIETYFGLLKRTAKKDNVEILRVSSGQKKINNALTALNQAIINIERNRVFKNRTSCKFCPFYKTEHCK